MRWMDVWSWSMIGVARCWKIWRSKNKQPNDDTGAVPRAIVDQNSEKPLPERATKEGTKC